MIRQAFPDHPSNRFSALSNKQVITPETETTSYQESSQSPPCDDDVSYVVSTTNGSSNEDLLDNMSLLSNSELHDQAEEANMFDDGYETDTTDNTSPKKHKKGKRTSSTFAKECLANFFLFYQESYSEIIMWKDIVSFGLVS